MTGVLITLSGRRHSGPDLCRELAVGVSVGHVLLDCCPAPAGTEMTEMPTDAELPKGRALFALTMVVPGKTRKRRAQEEPQGRE
jgi:hypothetical protein